MLTCIGLTGGRLGEISARLQLDAEILHLQRSMLTVDLELATEEIETLDSK